jgi:glyoxylase-like metal-dependent hydrolase (beta-lactamase superfamily II)
LEVYEDDHLRLVKEGPLGSFANNAYLVQDRASGDTVIVDAPQDATRILDALEGGTVTRIVITHRHADHWASIDALKSAIGAPVACHEADAERYRDKIDATIADGEDIAVGALRVRAIHTPGHTPGSLCFLVGRHLLSGDTLFPGGPGRSDSPEALQQSIASITTKLFALPDQTLVHPGHGDGTTIGQSKGEYAVFASKQHPPDLHGDVTWDGS